MSGPRRSKPAIGQPVDRSRPGNSARAPAGPAPEDPRELDRLLARMAEPGMSVEPYRRKLIFRQAPRGVSLPTRFPAALLAPLLADGAIRPLPGGRYGITPEGRARLIRQAAGDVAAPHRAVETRPDPEAPDRQVQVNLREDALALLLRHERVAHLVGPAEHQAGQRLRQDLHLAGLIPTVTMNWNPVPGQSGAGTALSLPDQVIAARQRVSRALAALGPDFSGILMDVCGFGKGLEQLEREQALPARSGKVALAYALRMLARHYGLSNLARGFRHGEVEAWRALTTTRPEQAEPPADPA
jgi:hypothetical protein